MKGLGYVACGLAMVGLIGGVFARIICVPMVALGLVGMIFVLLEIEE